MVGKHKAFDPALLEKYDSPVREKIKTILGDFVQDNPDIYEQDLIINHSECRYKFLELQVCSSWIEDKFPRDFPYIYERKKRYGEDTLFMTFNNSLSKCLMFDIRILKNNQPVRIKKYDRRFIYEIPWFRVLRVNLDCLDIDVVLAY